jgi:hypothetical protein
MAIMLAWTFVRNNWQAVLFAAALAALYGWHHHSITVAVNANEAKHVLSDAKNEAAWSNRIKVADALTAGNQNRFESTVATIQTNHIEDTKNAKIKSDAVLASVRAGFRLRDPGIAPAKPSATGKAETITSPSMVDDRSRGELSGIATTFLLAESDRADNIAKTLTAAQQYIRAQTAACVN